LHRVLTGVQAKSAPCLVLPQDSRRHVEEKEWQDINTAYDLFTRIIQFLTELINLLSGTVSEWVRFRERHVLLFTDTEFAQVDLFRIDQLFTDLERFRDQLDQQREEHEKSREKVWRPISFSEATRYIEKTMLNNIAISS